MIKSVCWQTCGKREKYLGTERVLFILCTCKTICSDIKKSDCSYINYMPYKSVSATTADKTDHWAIQLCSTVQIFKRLPILIIVSYEFSIGLSCHINTCCFQAIIFESLEIWMKKTRGREVGKQC